MDRYFFDKIYLINDICQDLGDINDKILILCTNGNHERNLKNKQLWRYNDIMKPLFILIFS